MEVSVIIVSMNNYEVLSRCLGQYPHTHLDLL